MKGNILKLVTAVALTLSMSAVAVAKKHGHKGNGSKQTNPGAEGGLEGVMKEMAFSIKGIQMTINDPSMNSINVQLANRFIQAAGRAKVIIPDTVRQLPQPEQNTRKALYEEMMDNSIELGGFLVDSLTKNDQTKALHFLDQIKAMEKDGHKEFKGNDLQYNLQSNLQPMNMQASPDLKSAMKIMGTNLKLIQAQMTDPAMNQASSRLADEIVAGAKDSKTFVPTTVSTLPADQQAARLVIYNQMLDKTIALATKLSQALATGDTTAAQGLINDLTTDKKDGHFEFK
jgi:hypothetical protein